jgi:putative transposase
MANKKKIESSEMQEMLSSAEEIQRELDTATSIDDFFGKEGIFSRLFGSTLERMLEAELTDDLGYEPYAVEGRNSGNSRNGNYSKKIRTSGGDTTVRVPRDRNGEFEPKLLKKYATSSNEIEDKIVTLYAKGLSVRDIQDTLQELYGIDVSPTTVSHITEKVWPLVEEWQNRPLEEVYPIIYLDAIHIKLRREGRVESTAVYLVLGVDLKGKRDVLGQWVGDGAEGANFWLSVVSDLQSRGVQDILIACIDGLTGFKDAIQAIYPDAQIQRCVIHQIRNSLKYVTWKDRKPFMADLKTVYQAPTREEAERNLIRLGETWNGKYAMAVRSWENNWEDLATFFDFPAEIRRLIYTTNSVESYNRQIRKVIKTKSSFPSVEAARKLLFLANQNITRKWTMPIQNWPKILNQLAIRFEGRFPI